MTYFRAQYAFLPRKRCRPNSTRAAPPPPRPTATTSIVEQFALHSRRDMFTTILTRSRNRAWPRPPRWWKASMTSPALPPSILSAAKTDWKSTTSAPSFSRSGSARPTNWFTPCAATDFCTIWSAIWLELFLWSAKAVSPSPMCAGSSNCVTAPPPQPPLRRADFFWLASSTNFHHGGTEKTRIEPQRKNLLPINTDKRGSEKIAKIAKTAKDRRNWKTSPLINTDKH